MLSPKMGGCIVLILTIRDKKKDMDIMVRPDQRIGDVLQILKENGKICFVNESMTIYSIRKKEYINSKMTFQQSLIYSGDILVLKNE